MIGLFDNNSKGIKSSDGNYAGGVIDPVQMYPTKCDFQYGPPVLVHKFDSTLTKYIKQWKTSYRHQCKNKKNINLNHVFSSNENNIKHYKLPICK